MHDKPQGDVAGNGLLEFSLVGQRTAVIRARAASPLRLLTPRHNGRGAWVFASTFGGGLVSGDAIALDVHVGAGALALLGTQASTKVYRARTPGAVCTQSMHVRLDADAVFVSAPDPVVCFANSAYEQRQQIEMTPASALVMLDWFTSGRSAAGERWAFSRYKSRTDVRVSGRLVLRDSILLDSADGPVGDPCRMGNIDCYASVVLIGDRLRDTGRRIVESVGRQPLRSGPNPGELTFAASPLANGFGVVLRVAGAGAEPVGRWIRQHLSIITDLFDDDPWRLRQC